MADGNDQVLLTIRDASRATGLSVKALRRRIERGTLPARLVDGRRRVPMSALLRAGLLVTQREQHASAAGVSPETVLALGRRVAALEERVRLLEAAAAPDGRTREPA